jgi:hypothetical protein
MIDPTVSIVPMSDPFVQHVRPVMKGMSLFTSLPQLRSALA